MPFSSFALARSHAGMFAVVLLACCGDSDPAPSTSEDDSSAEADDAASSSTCSTEGQERNCSCTGAAGTGTRTCKNGKLSRCDCSDSQDDAPSGRNSQCKAGYFTGNFVGRYRPGAFGLGILPSDFEVDISGGKSFFDDSLEPLSFTLTESYENAGGEFATFTVGNGCMQGIASAGPTQSPFVAKVTGDLDCATGKFEGMLEGYYALVGIPGADFSFTGPFTAQFALSDDSLRDGAWSVAEPPAISGDAAGGGEGTWDAKWTSDVAPETDKPDPCADIGPGGTHGPIADAGVADDAITP